MDIRKRGLPILQSVMKPTNICALVLVRLPYQLAWKQGRVKFCLSTISTHCCNESSRPYMFKLQERFFDGVLVVILNLGLPQ